MRIRLDIGEYLPERRAIVRPDGGEVSLTPTENRLLRYLVERPREVLDVRHLLREVWGWSAKVESRTVYIAVHRLREKIEIDPRNPRHILAASSAGYRFEPLEGVEQAAEIPRVDGRRLWGRGAEMAHLRGLLSGGERRITLVGPGGIGKTALARAVAEAERRGGGWSEVVFCSAAMAQDKPSLVAAIFQALDLRGGGNDSEAYLLSALAERGALLLVLDNLEQVADPAREMLARWAEGAPDVATLVTSQVLLEAPGEVVVWVPPLSIDDPERGAEVSAAVSLLLERACAARPGLEIDAQARTIAVEIARRLDGIPLSLHLAGARARTMSLADIAARLALRPLNLLAEDAPERGRHQAIRDTIAWSWGLLDPAEQDAWAQLSVFCAPFTLAAAEAVLDLSAWPSPPWIPDVIDALVDRSLLRRVPEPGEGEPARFGWIESLRAFSAERAAERAAERQDALRDRHARFFSFHGGDKLMFASAGAEGRAQRRAFLGERPDIEAAFLWASRGGDPALLNRLVLTVTHAARTQGPLNRAEALLARASLLPDLPPDVAMNIASMRGEMLFYSGQYAASVALLEEGLSRFRGQVNAHNLFAALYRLVQGLQAVGRSGEVGGLLDELADVLGPQSSPINEGLARRLRGATRQIAGRSIEAEADLLAGLRLARAEGQDRLAGLCLGNLATLYRDRGQLADARACATESLSIAMSLENDDRVPIELTTLAMLDYLEGRSSAARAGLEEAHRRIVRMGTLTMRALVEGNLALVLMLLGEHQAAISTLRTLASDPTTARTNQAMARSFLGGLLIGQGRTIEARIELELALEVARQVRSLRVEALARRWLAELALREGNVEDAKRHAAAGVQAVAPAGELPLEAPCRATLAEALAMGGEAQAAEEELSVIAARRATLTSPLTRLQIALLEGRAWLALGRRQEARDALSRAEQAAAGMEIGPAAAESQDMAALRDRLSG